MHSVALPDSRAVRAGAHSGCRGRQLGRRDLGRAGERGRAGDVRGPLRRPRRSARTARRADSVLSASHIGVLPKAVQRAINKAMSSVVARVRPQVLPRGTLGRCSAVPLIGFHLVDAIRSGAIRLKPGIAEFTRTGVRFTDGSEEPFDRVILATGYRAALGSSAIRSASTSAASRHATTASSAATSGISTSSVTTTTRRGGLRNIAEDARITAKAIHV